jgi:hypothetical protein
MVAVLPKHFGGAAAAMVDAPVTAATMKQVTTAPKALFTLHSPPKEALARRRLILDLLRMLVQRARPVPAGPDAPFTP